MLFERLSQAITDAGIPLERIEGLDAKGAPRLVFQTRPQLDEKGNPILDEKGQPVLVAIASDEQLALAAQIVAKFDDSPEADTAWLKTQQQQSAQQEAAHTLISETSPEAIAMRALAGQVLKLLSDVVAKVNALIAAHNGKVDDAIDVAAAVPSLEDHLAAAVSVVAQDGSPG